MVLLRSIVSLFIFWMAMSAGATAMAAVHLTLPEALKIASQKHVAVLLAGQDVEQALARISQSRSYLLPDISATASQTRRTEDFRSTGIPIPGDPHIGPFNSFDARLRITQSIFDPQAIARLNAARQGKNSRKPNGKKPNKMPWPW